MDIFGLADPPCINPTLLLAPHLHFTVTFEPIFPLNFFFIVLMGRLFCQEFSFFQALEYFKYLVERASITWLVD